MVPEYLLVELALERLDNQNYFALQVEREEQESPGSQMESSLVDFLDFLG